ncbi:MAG: BatD family protein [Kofleriaceae bacterium]|nr:BatD family protein [Kofleriaceae bacterium]
MFALTLGISVFAAPLANAQSVELSVKTREIFSDVPFLLQISATGFEESPEPEIEPWSIEGAKLQFQGVSPSVVSRRTIINGRMSQSREITFVFNYRVEPSRPGRFQIPVLTVKQGTTIAKSRPSGFEAGSVSESQDMRITMKVPDRAVWLGESFIVNIDLFLRTTPRDLNFTIPLFEHPGFEVEAPEVPGADVLAISVAGKELQLPYQTSEARQGGVKGTRFQFTALVTPTKAGRFDLDAARVVAKLKTGTGRDAFGFRQARYTRFKSTGKPFQFEVKALPASGRPASFSNAVGSSFSIQVEASRSVVSVGEPIELSVSLGGQRGLEGLSLPTLVGSGGMDPKLFDLVGNSGTGQMSDDGLRKVFKVSVVLKSAKAREIPAIEFAYFDPELATYRVARSQPIALNVNGATLVGADDVVSSVRKSKKGSKAGGAIFAGDLSPSQGDSSLRTMLSLGAITPVLFGLYLFPLLLLGIALWFRRTGDSRGRNSDVKQALAEVEGAAKTARTEAAAQSVAGLVKSVRELGRITGNRPGTWLSELESLAFDPSCSSRPADGKLVDQALDEARQWCKKPQSKGASKAIPVAVLLALALSGGPRIGHAEATHTGASIDLESLRADYIKALESEQRGDRTHRFSELVGRYAQAVKAYPGRPELLADWGNAALGAGDLGTAALAYKRALALDRSLARASNNLEWIRSQMPSSLVPSSDAGAVDSLFFWHRDWSLAMRHLVAALAFMAFVFLLLPWGKYQFARRRIAIAPALLFVATLVSALLEPDHSDAAVVVQDGEILRSADSTGAPAKLKAPLPAGLEVSVTQRGTTWSQVTLADGTTGWLSANSIVRVAE